MHSARRRCGLLQWIALRLGSNVPQARTEKVVHLWDANMREGKRNWSIQGLLFLEAKKSFPHIHWLFIFSFSINHSSFPSADLNLLVANFINIFLILGEWQLLNLKRLSANWCALGWSKIGFEFAAVSCPNWVLPVSSALKQIKCDVGSQCRHVCAL